MLKQPKMNNRFLLLIILWRGLDPFVRMISFPSKEAKKACMSKSNYDALS